MKATTKSLYVPLIKGSRVASPSPIFLGRSKNRPGENCGWSDLKQTVHICYAVFTQWGRFDCTRSLARIFYGCIQFALIRQNSEVEENRLQNESNNKSLYVPVQMRQNEPHSSATPITKLEVVLDATGKDRREWSPTPNNLERMQTIPTPNLVCELFVISVLLQPYSFPKWLVCKLFLTLVSKL